MHLIFSCSLIYFSSNPSKPTLNHQQSLQSRNSTSTLTDSRTKELEAHLREKEKDLRNKNTKIGKKSSVSSWNEACFRPNRTTKSRRRWSMSRVGAKDTQDRVCNKRVLAKPGRKPQENIHLWSRTFFAQIKGTLQSFLFPIFMFKLAEQSQFHRRDQEKIKLITRELADEKEKLQSTLDSQSVQRREVQQQKYAYTELENQVSFYSDIYHHLLLGSRSHGEV